MMKIRNTRFSVDLDYLRELDREGEMTAKYIIGNPLKSIRFLEKTLNDVIMELSDEGFGKKQG
jgi:hypothetical protein